MTAIIVMYILSLLLYAFSYFLWQHSYNIGYGGKKEGRVKVKNFIILLHIISFLIPLINVSVSSGTIFGWLVEYGTKNIGFEHNSKFVNWLFSDSLFNCKKK